MQSQSMAHFYTFNFIGWAFLSMMYFDFVALFNYLFIKIQIVKNSVDFVDCWYALNYYIIWFVFELEY